MNNDGWFADPVGAHELRYFDGATWTDHVCDQGRRDTHQWRSAPTAPPSHPAHDPAAQTSVGRADSTSWYEPAATYPTGGHYSGYGQPGHPPPGYPGYEHAAPGYSGPGQPAGAGGQSGTSKRSNRLGIIAAAVALVVVALAGLGVSLLASGTGEQQRTDAAADNSPRPSPPATPSPTPAQTPSPAPSESAALEPAPTPSGPFGRPELKTSVPPIRVVGPSFATGEPTYTMNFAGWPFAFRVPATFGCIKHKTDQPEAKAWVCRNEKDRHARHFVGIMFKPCPTSCTASEQRTMAAAWYGAPAPTPISRDATTTYREDPSNNRGLYTLSMSHFFGSTPGGPLRWQVGTYVESPAATRSTVHKVVNDVRTQTP